MSVGCGWWLILPLLLATYQSLGNIRVAEVSTLDCGNSDAQLKPSSTLDSFDYTRSVIADTLKLPVDSLTGKFAGEVSHSHDSVWLHFRKFNNDASKIVDSLADFPDSILMKTRVITTAVETGLTKAVDSAQQVVSKHLETIRDRGRAMEAQVGKKAEGISNVIDQKQSDLRSELQNGFDKATNGTVAPPVEKININGADVPSLVDKISDVEVNKTALPALGDINEIPGSNTAKGSLNIPVKDLNVEQLKNKIDINEIDKISGIKGDIDKASSQLAEVSQYANELDKIRNLDSASIENAAKKAEEEIRQIEQVRQVEEQTQVITRRQAEYEALLQRYRNKKLMREEITRKAKDIVNDKLTQNSEEVKSAMSTLSKSKSKKSIKELLSWKNNSMNGKPVGQRLIPGITLQYYNRHVFMMDFGLQLGYRISGRIRAGIGGVYRAGFDNDYPLFVKGMNVYGGRTYADFIIRKGIYIHGEYELLKAYDYTATASTAPEIRQYVSAGYFGLGKQFNITKKIKGHTILLYRAEFAGRLYDQSKVNLRLGFDLRTDKKKRDTERSVTQ